MYYGPQGNGWKYVPSGGSHHSTIPRKEPTAFDYVPDGSGRDSYIIRNYGLKRNYQSGYREYEKSLRQDQKTPMMDSKIRRKSHQPDITQFLNWPNRKTMI